MDTDSEKRLADFIEAVGRILGRSERRAAFAVYVVGLLSSLEKKTVEAIAAMTCQDPDEIKAAHQRLLHVVGQSTWDDGAVRRFVGRYALDAMTANSPVSAWIVDDTGFAKRGPHSVGTQRQYSGTLGKVDNCQVGVSLSAATEEAHCPVDFALYVPEQWASDPLRREKTRIPEDMEFKTKPQIAVDLMDAAIAAGVPLPTAMVADAAYGRSGEFRAAVRQRGMHFAVGVDPTIKVWRLDARGIKRGPATTAGRLAQRATFRKVTWAEGTRGKQSARFAFFRVVAQGDSTAERDPIPMWLIIEWCNGDRAPSKYYLSSLPKKTTHRRLVWWVHQRWRTERVYQDMKQELGLDDYEGRSFTGWNHHVTAAMMCYCFITAEQARLSPPHDGAIESPAFDLAA